MKKLGLVLSLAAFCLAPVVADAQWGQQGSFVYPEPQIGYPYSGTPQVMYPAPPVMYPAPPIVIYNPPPVMIQVVPALPRVVVAPVRPEKRIETRIQGDGVSVVTKCANCTVTNTVYAERAKVGNGNGNGKKEEAKPTPSAAKSWWDDPNSLWIWLIAAAVAILTLLAILLGRPLWGGSRSGPPNPAPEPVLPAPAAAPAAPRRPHQRVHTKKCQHEGCPHTVTICCHAGDNDRDGQAR